MTDELLVKYLLRETNQEEDREVKEWIGSDPAHAKQFADMELIWSTSKNLASKSTIDENAAWERFKVKAAQSNSSGSNPVIKPLKQTNYSWLKIAAVLVVVIGFGLLLFKDKETNVIANQSVVTETLPDGSVVTLNKNSSLTYSSALISRRRKVQLSKGEVFFNVKPDKSKPFVITADDVSVEVVGTSFNVKHSSESTEVIVETGIVKVSEGGETVELHAGEKVLVNTKTRLKVEQNTDMLYNYYRTKQFVADNTPLWRLVEVLNEAYDVDIVIENPSIRNQTLTTTFNNQSLNEILKIISETLNISVTQKDHQIILK